MRSRFDEQLAILNRELIEMGALCEEAIALAAKALTDKDKTMAAKVAAMDAEIDQKERNIESMCLKLLLQQQPVARDLRQISAALKMITDMERIGDQAEDISEIVITLDGRYAENSALLKGMAESTIQMVTESVDAYVKRDTALAQQVIKMDDIVDDYFDQVKAELISKIAGEPADGEYALDLLMIAKYLERIGDHAVNIAEWVIFSVTGKHGEEKGRFLFLFGILQQKQMRSDKGPAFLPALSLFYRLLISCFAVSFDNKSAGSGAGDSTSEHCCPDRFYAYPPQ